MSTTGFNRNLNLLHRRIHDCIGLNSIRGTIQIFYGYIFIMEMQRASTIFCKYDYPIL